MAAEGPNLILTVDGSGSRDLHQTDTMSHDFLLTVDGSGSRDFHQTDTMIRDFLLTVDSSRSRDLHWTATVSRDCLLTLAIHGTRWSVRSPSDGQSNWTAWSHLQQQRKIGRLQLKGNHDRGSRSRFDRGPIAPRSGLFHR